MIMCGAPGKGNLEDRVIFWIDFPLQRCET